MHKSVQWHEVGSPTDLPTLSLQTAGTQQVLVINTEPPRATAPLCPHKFAPLEEGTLEENCLHCPVHDAAFHLDSGIPREGDGWAGQLQTFPARLRDGIIEVQC